MMPQSFVELLPLVAPVLVLELALLGLALFDLARRDHVRFDNKLVWAAIIVLVSLVGPLAYFVLGREEA